MRTIVDIPEEHVKALDSIGKKEDLSRTELVRRAVAAYLEAEQSKSNAALDQYFGILKGSDMFEGMDGLAYERKIRADWDEREADMDRRLAETRNLNDRKQDDYEG